MKIELFQADIVDDEYNFTKLPYTGSVPREYRSNGFTYTPNDISYHDTKFFIYRNKILNASERKDLEDEWRRYCPY